MLELIQRLLGLGGRKKASAPRKKAKAAPTKAKPAGESSAKAARPAAGGARVQRAELEAVATGKPSEHAELLEMLDGKGHFTHQLSGRDQKVLAEVGRRVEEGQLTLPHLPATSLAAMDLAAKPSADVSEVVKLIATDPVMSSELLKVSNSVLYAGVQECETLHEAVMRMGLQKLRGMILSVSMRTVMLRDAHLSHVADAIWRQAHSVGQIARKIAPLVGMDGEHAFLIGLLHDIGKVALLKTVRAEVKDAKEIGASLLGQAFYFHHEAAGEAIAREWKLPEEVVSVAAHHHRYERNEEHPRSAALASLAHRVDLRLAMGGSPQDEELMGAPELEFLGVPPERREEVLTTAFEGYSAKLAPADEPTLAAAA